MFRHRTTSDELARLEAFHSFLRSELTKEVRHAVKAVQKEAASSDGLSSNQFQIEVADNDYSRELLSLIEACIIHGMNKKYVRKTKSDGRETAQVNLWALMEKLLSKSDIKSLTLENKQLKTKSGLSRAAIRNFMNTQVLDCYLQALMLDKDLLNKHYEPYALLRDPDNAEVFKNSLQGLERLKFNFTTNSPILDSWSRHTLELAAIVAPQHQRKSNKAMLPKPRAPESLTAAGDSVANDFDDSASMMSSVVTESICSTMTDFAGDEGVEVFRSKMSRRRRRAQKRNPVLSTGSFENQELFDDAISVVSDARETIKSSEPTCYLSELEESMGNDGKDRTEVDQAMENDQIQTLYSGKNRESSPLTKVAEEERKQYTKLVFTEQELTPNTSDTHFVEDSLNRATQDQSSEIEDESYAPIESQKVEDDEVTEKNEAEVSDTESQCDIHALEEIEASPPVKSCYAPSGNEDDIIQTVVDEDDEDEHNQNEECASTVEETISANQKAFAAMFSKEMTDDDEGLPWLDRVTEKHRESLSGRPVGARHREGFLQRKGDWTGFWRRRYFKLADHQLTYYRSDTDESAALTIPVDAMLDVIEDEKMKPFCFRVEIRGRKSLYLCGYSHHDSAKWVADLRYEIEHFGSAESNHFEVISVNSYDSRSSEYSSVLKNQLLVLPADFGLPAQNYRCFECETPIGIIYGPPRHCAFTGKYYCNKCHDNSVSVIPARMIFNWDLSARSICKRARCYLSRVQHDPLLEINETNSALYGHVPALERVRKLRIRLQKMEPYLKTCSKGKEIYDKFAHGREYLTGDIHRYSVADLVEFQEESLETSLSQLYEAGKRHISLCETCGFKGFYCELCGSDNLIYPFETEETSSCLKCCACFHANCFRNTLESCPKCTRIENRRRLREAAELEHQKSSDDETHK
ncbi:Oidioi.mRNA.OKI2018_I69.XSR.g15718.t1.cds [Oikopleura dioica]|uniref:Oidioi.mRNA.OKI2018_I69.XSR.g15718.t1.cds n=1 Tax=Oikopleura dioica TaxID=34765 RepID=A0ABN7SMZ2_OIKDI|nr:Oidioi.mRNA.OKI2018_I69.XSR.g15718.t1.cds [Oikopleura dioica]